MSWHKRIGFVLLALSLMVMGSTGMAAAQEGAFLPQLTGGSGVDGLEALALEKVAAQTGSSVGELELLASSTASYPVSGAEAVGFKILGADGQIHAVTLTPDGAAADPEALATAELEAYDAKYGKLDIDLAEYLENAPAGEAVRVTVVVNAPSYTPNRAPLEQVRNAGAEAGALVASSMAENDARYAAFVAEATAETVSRMEAMGLDVTANSLAPMVSTAMTESELDEVASWDSVRRIYRELQYKAGDEPREFVGEPTDEDLYEPELEIVRLTGFFQRLHQARILGFGVKLGQTEVGGRVTTSNPYLDLYDGDRLVNDNTNVCATASTHSTGVAGIMVSSHPDRFGVAPGARLWAGGSCAGWTSELQTALNSAVAWGAMAINNSWGNNAQPPTPGASEIFMDNIVRNNGRTVVIAAGNDGTTATPTVGSPARAYNSISVANFDDGNTVTWSDDIMRASSSYGDPTSTHGDRELPEVTGPGTNINSTTTSSPWTGGIGSGTSYAAPVINGMAGLMMQREPGLRAWPEAIKAIIMATAVHNIEGAARLSDKDGVGAVYAPFADHVLRGIRGDLGGVSYNCTNPDPLDLSMVLVSGKRTRVVIAWDQNTAYANYASQPSADIDLRVLRPNGTTVASSTSWDNTYEIVDFYADVTGTHTLRIDRISCDTTNHPGFLGWAWYRMFSTPSP